MPVPLRKENERFTYADYVSWPNEERWEILEGIPYAMSPAPSRLHQEISGNLFFELKRFLKTKKCKIYAAPFDVRLPEQRQTDEETITVVQPDIAIICDPTKLDDKGCKGAPDFIAEIASPDTLNKDMRYKLSIYERHGVPEYWVVHPGDYSVSVYKLNERHQYDGPVVYTKKNQILLNLGDGNITVNLESVFP